MPFRALNITLFVFFVITPLLLWSSGCGYGGKGLAPLATTDGVTVTAPSTNTGGNTNTPTTNTTPPVTFTNSGSTATNQTSASSTNANLATQSLNSQSLFSNLDWSFLSSGSSNQAPVSNLATRPFAQILDYCAPEVNELRGSIFLSNPLSVPVTLGVRGTLVYYAGAAPGVLKTEQTQVTISLLPGQTTTVSLANSAVGYGCHGIASFYGVINGPLALQSLSVYGSFNSTENRTTTPSQKVSYAFPVGAGFPSQQTPPEVAISKSTQYCSPYQSYLQGQFIVYNPTSGMVQGSSDLKLSYLVAGGVPKEDSIHVNISINPGDMQLFGVSSSQPGYGCYGSMTVSGTIKNFGSSPVIAAGNLLTSLTDGAQVTGYGNVPFSVNNGLPF